MSRAAVRWARQIKLRGAAKAVLRVLADMADEKTNSCYPGQDTLAEDTGTSLRTVRRALHVIEDAGLVLVERRFNKRGHRTSDRYWLQLDVTEARPAEEAATTGTAQSHPAAAEIASTPVDKSPTGQPDRRSICPSLPANLSIPTGQPDRSHMDESPEESPGGSASAAPSSPTCGQHPSGSGGRPCGPCGDARRLWDAHNRRAVTAPPPRPAPRYDFDVYCQHLQLRADDCDACAEDARSALRAAGFLVGARA